MPNTTASTSDAKKHTSYFSAFAIPVVAVALLPLALFAFSLLGRYFFLAELAGNFRCLIMFALIPFVAILFLVKQRFLSLVFAVATAWSMIGVVSVYLPGSQPSAGPDVIKIMSFNVWTANYQKQAVLDRIIEHEPDVLTVLEYGNHWPDFLEVLNDEYPYQALEPRWHGFGVAIFSKLPLSNTQTFELSADETDNPMLVSRVQVGDRKIRLAAIHTLSPTNPYRLKIRNLQLKDAYDFLAQDLEPTIVMGDFNCTPWSPFLSDFLQSTQLRDSRQGFGYHASWHAKIKPFFIPIDHAFVSSDIHVHSRMVGAAAGSDHYPIIVEVSLSEDPVK